MSSERRKLKRYVRRIDARFHSGRLRGLGQVGNLSKQGLFIRSEQLPQTGAPIDVTIEMLNGQKVEISGRVRWTTDQLPGCEDTPRGFGVIIDGHVPGYLDFFESLLIG